MVLTHPGSFNEGDSSTPPKPTSISASMSAPGARGGAGTAAPGWNRLHVLVFFVVEKHGI